MQGMEIQEPDLNLPGRQLVHGPPPGPLKPLLHVQSLAELLPEGELDPEGQLEQVLDVVAPEAAEYLPLTQSVHASDPEDILYFPAGQFVQAVPARYCPA